MIKDTFIMQLNSDEDIEEFGLWAFGLNYENLISSELMKRWNDLHGDIYKLYAENKPANDITNMVELWRSSQ